jgi:hypothetical protein
MKKTAIKIALGILLITCIFIALLGCSSKSTPTPTTASNQATATADTITENLLKSVDSNNYTGFSKDLDSTAKSTLTQTSFDQLYNLVKSSVGDYRSKELVSATTQENRTTVVYIAKYTSEPANVLVTVAIQPVNNINLVNGFNVNSPKIAGQTVDVNQILAYADPETDNVLASLSKNDYVSFIKDMDQAMLAVETKTAFDQSYNFIKTGAGDYISKEFGNLIFQNNYYTIKYHAVYSNEPAGVWVTVSFDASQKIAGLFFDSPKLRAVQTK